MTTPAKNAVRTSITLLVFTLLGTGLLVYTFDLTRDQIARSEADAQRKLIAEVLPRALYDNDIVNDVMPLPPTPALGTTQASQVYRARLSGQPSAVVLEAIAPDGYSGRIKLLIAVRTDGAIAGVRVVAHQETPGLGDYIDIGKSDWIKVFDHASLTTHAAQAWKVKKDGGRFDYMTGATITPRAIVKAVHQALRYYEQHGNALFALPADSQETP